MDREKQLKELGAKIVNKFKDEKDNTFIIFTHHLIKGNLIVGDLTNWEWYRLDKSGKFAIKDFVFDDKVANTIQKVIELADKLK